MQTLSVDVLFLNVNLAIHLLISDRASAILSRAFSRVSNDSANDIRIELGAPNAEPGTKATWKTEYHSTIDGTITCKEHRTCMSLFCLQDNLLIQIDEQNEKKLYLHSILSCKRGLWVVWSLYLLGLNNF